MDDDKVYLDIECECMRIELINVWKVKVWSKTLMIFLIFDNCQTQVITYTK
jgi:hypothetical protein